MEALLLTLEWVVINVHLRKDVRKRVMNLSENNKVSEYKVNPKMADSGLLACIPQTGRCPFDCEDCFFQSGRSYLEPLDENLPNIPPDELRLTHVIRVNDGFDSSVDMAYVLSETCHYPMKFYNTRNPKDLEVFEDPVVLTINPDKMTDTDYVILDNIPKNLMFVRFRVNLWNLEMCESAVKYYSKHQVPIVLTFMAYFTSTFPEQWKLEEARPHEVGYIWRKRTLNSYWAITTAGFEFVMEPYRRNKWVSSCGKIEGELGDTHCRFCGNCLREYFATKERLNNG